MSHAGFLALPRRLQAQLTRLAAGEYILDGRNRSLVKRWLGRALATNPFDVRTGMLYLLFCLNPELARGGLARYRSRARRAEIQLPVPRAFPQNSRSLS